MWAMRPSVNGDDGGVVAIESRHSRGPGGWSEVQENASERAIRNATARLTLPHLGVGREQAQAAAYL